MKPSTLLWDDDPGVLPRGGDKNPFASEGRNDLVRQPSQPYKSSYSVRPKIPLARGSVDNVSAFALARVGGLIFDRLWQAFDPFAHIFGRKGSSCLRTGTRENFTEAGR